MVELIYLTPWKGFDPAVESAVGQAVELISRRLSDGQWHDIRDLVDDIAIDTALEAITVRNLLNGMATYGDVIRKGFGRRTGYKQVRLAGRYL